jgi:hypothetical protein
MSKLLQSKLRGEQQRPPSRHGCWDLKEQRPKKGYRVAGERKLLLSATSTHSECLLSVPLEPLLYWVSVTLMLGLFWLLPFFSSRAPEEDFAPWNLFRFTVFGFSVGDGRDGGETAN